MYTEKELAAIAKRENNVKRNYLVLNRLQGKHLPIEPKKALDMFRELGDIVKEAYPNETLLLIGFAETATAIGAALAIQLNSYYMQTTREQMGNVEYFYFTESHSHATEQKLVKNDLDGLIGKADRVVFVEDEVTTGNTILNIIELMEKQYPHKIKFSVASLLNGMNQDSMQVYRKRNIAVHYLVKTNHERYSAIALQYSGNGKFHKANVKPVTGCISVAEASDYMDARRLTKGESYQYACENLWRQVSELKTDEESEHILVLGTEEFMYPALYVAERISQKGKSVRFHATTRSPILVSGEDAYPLHERYELESLYEKGRTTYIYELGKYDEVFVITDAKPGQQDGIYSLANALIQSGNQKIQIVRWCQNEKFL